MTDETTPEPAAPAATPEAASGLARLRAMTRGADAPAAATTSTAAATTEEPAASPVDLLDAPPAPDEAGHAPAADLRPVGTPTTPPAPEEAGHAAADGLLPAGTPAADPADGALPGGAPVPDPLQDAVVVAPSGHEIPAQGDADADVPVPVAPVSDAEPAARPQDDALWATEAVPVVTPSVPPASAAPLSLDKGDVPVQPAAVAADLTSAPSKVAEKAPETMALPVLPSGAAEPERASAPPPEGYEDRAPARRKGGFGLAAILTSAVLAVLLVLAVVFYVNERSRHDNLASENRLRTSATAAARSYAISFTQFDYTTFAQQIVDLKAISTPNFQAKLDDLQTALAATLTSTMGKSTSSIDDVAVETLTKTEANVMVFVDQSNTNSAVTTPRVDQYRLIIKLEHSSTAKSGWLVNDILVV